MTSEQNIDSIFGAAVEIPCEEEPRKFLQEICGQNVELRNRIEQLLKAHGEAGNFMPERDDRTIERARQRNAPEARLVPIS